MEPEFKVIIVGGSIAGLTLAHCLDHLGVDYVVLEKRKEIAPQEGASVVLMPHAGRILEQLGLIDEIGKFIEPLHTAHVSYPDGFKHTDRSPQVLFERFGIPLAFLERRRLLQSLYSSLRDQSRVLVDRTVVSVQQNEGDISVVRVEDGSIYRGDLVVGADGVHSRVRREMWRLAEFHQPVGITHQEKNGMKIDYVCVFGISNAVPNLRPGEQVTGFQDGRSLLVFPGQNGRVYWFLFKKLDRQYEYRSAPQWSKGGTTKIAEEFARDDVWAGLQFQHIWMTREVVGITNLEENVFSTWHSGRMVCIGDSMHKFAPNTGQGANIAIEDAAISTLLPYATVNLTFF
ncbi:FAD-dependent monooxygenase spyC [Aspergillus affinis]|uniref:FAD-dependent monooxygenase spyC n=1 Tax=Aspergillus affinis TaxID=1070780 RepID=UPI0022FEA1BB|nr:uncharacterized protein KD926_004735 [Aspergillus affinis]KAI9042944.1 hypothetical protein KD926_004735 [Aspergillus affinis]